MPQYVYGKLALTNVERVLNIKIGNNECSVHRKRTG